MADQKWLIVVDLESMGTTPGSIITEIGAEAFALTRIDDHALGFHEVIDYGASKKEGFQANKLTMSWWASVLSLDPNTSKRDQEFHFRNKWRNTHSVTRSLRHFTEFYGLVCDVAGGAENVLLIGNDIDFDKSILEAYYKKMNHRIPWHYRSWLSLPTFVWLVEYLTGVDVKKKVRESWTTSHDALDDAKQEVAMLKTGLDLITPLRYHT